MDPQKGDSIAPDEGCGLAHTLEGPLVQGSDSQWLKSALRIVYCPTCGLPPEYCEFTKKFTRCKPWLVENYSDLYPHLKAEMAAKKNRERRPKGRFTKWCPIPSLHNVLQAVNKGEVKPGSALSYRGKIKLHGTNASVTVQQRGKGKPLVYFQSRNTFITVGKDHHDFAAWAGLHEQLWVWIFNSGRRMHRFKKLTVFGEWCGRGIMKGAAVCSLKTRHWAIFAVLLDNDRVIIYPDHISRIFSGAWGGQFECRRTAEDSSSVSPATPEEVFVIPWLTDVVTFEFGNEAAQLAMADRINKMVDRVDEEDPWVKETFGISGTGEGIVWYPLRLSSFTQPWSDFKSFTFKTKGVTHRVNATRASALIEPAHVECIEDFGEMFITHSRLRQGWEECFPGDDGLSIEGIADFVEWVGADVYKECQAEMSASNLSWDDVRENVRMRARKWFISELNLLGGVLVG